MVKKNIKYQDMEESGEKAPGPKSPTEASMAPSSPAYFRNLDVTTSIPNGKFPKHYFSLNVDGSFKLIPKEIPVANVKIFISLQPWQSGRNPRAKLFQLWKLQRKILLRGFG